MTDLLRRHDLFTVAPEAWAAHLAGRPDLDGLPHLSAWARDGRPVIVRRRHPGEEAGHLPAGLPLPPSAGKRRIGLAVPWSAVLPHPPLTLAAARAAAPPAWRPTLDTVLALAIGHGLVPRVFGGLLWQSLTGLPYLTVTSDLDLLIPVAGSVPRGFLAGLTAIAAAAPMRLDGEVMLADGSGVHWRELGEAPPRGAVLAKRIGDVRLVPADPLLAGT